MSPRLQNFKSLSSDPWYRRHFQKLTLSDIASCEKFIESHVDKSKDEYAQLVARWGVLFDFEVTQSKRYPVMQELVLVAGTMEK